MSDTNPLSKFAPAGTKQPAATPAAQPEAAVSPLQAALDALAAKTGQAGKSGITIPQASPITKAPVVSPSAPVPAATQAVATTTTQPAKPKPTIVIPTKAQAKAAPKPLAQPKKLAEATTSIKAIAAAQEAARLGKQVTEVPEELYTLDPAISQITGLNAEALRQTLAKTYVSIIEDQPDLGGLLEAINKNMRQYEELAYLLTPAQLGLYFDGLMKVTSTQIKTTTPKVSAAKVAAQLEKDGGLDAALLLL